MIGIVIVSHSAKAAEGITELAAQMANKNVKLTAAGGTASGEIGTNAQKIYDAILAANTGDGVLIMVDLGSAVMSAEIALDLLDADVRSKVSIADAPILEGTIVAAVQSSLGASLPEVAAAAAAARGMCKL